LVNLFGSPAADGDATMQEDFHQADDPPGGESGIAPTQGREDKGSPRLSIQL
jgi:hypothetical protein